MPPSAVSHRWILPSVVVLGLATVAGACARPGTPLDPTLIVAGPAPGPLTTLEFSVCHVATDGGLVPMKVEPSEWPEHEAHGDVRVGSLVPGFPWFVYNAACVAAEPEPVTVGFDEFSTHDTPFEDVTVSRVMVESLAGDWLVSTSYGQPAPFIYFHRPVESETITADVRVTAGGGLFRFQHLDVYSSTTRIPYQLVGTRGDSIVFQDEGEKPNTYGRFTILGTYNDNELIDALVIRLTNPNTGACCSNPVGLDNIRVLR